MDCASGTVLGFDEVYRATIKMNLAPRERVLLGETHPVFTEMMNSAKCSGNFPSITL